MKKFFFIILFLFYTSFCFSQQKEILCIKHFYNSIDSIIDLYHLKQSCEDTIKDNARIWFILEIDKEGKILFCESKKWINVDYNLVTFIAKNLIGKKFICLYDLYIKNREYNNTKIHIPYKSPLYIKE